MARKTVTINLSNAYQYGSNGVKFLSNSTALYPSSQNLDSYFFNYTTKTINGTTYTGYFPLNSGHDSTAAYGAIMVSIPKWWTGVIISINWIQSSEYDYDYGLLSKLDEYLPSGTTNPSSWTSVQESFKGKSGTGTTAYKNVSPGMHAITFKYIKDSSEDEGADLWGITGITITYHSILAYAPTGRRGQSYASGYQPVDLTNGRLATSGDYDMGYALTAAEISGGRGWVHAIPLPGQDSGTQSITVPSGNTHYAIWWKLMTTDAGRYSLNIDQTSGSLDTYMNVWEISGTGVPTKTSTTSGDDNSFFANSQPGATVDLQANSTYIVQLTQYANRNTWCPASGTALTGTYYLHVGKGSPVTASSPGHGIITFTNPNAFNVLVQWGDANNARTGPAKSSYSGGLVLVKANSTANVQYTGSTTYYYLTYSSAECLLAYPYVNAVNMVNGVVGNNTAVKSINAG